MMRKTVKKTLKINSLNGFDSLGFIRGIHDLGVSLRLEIDIDKKTEVYLSVYESYFFGRKNEIDSKFQVIVDLFRECDCEEANSVLSLDPFYVVVYVEGSPSIKSEQMSALVRCFLENKIKASIFINLEPLNLGPVETEFPFLVSFAIIVSAKEEKELEKKSLISVSLIQSIFGGKGSTIKTSVLGKRFRSFFRCLINGDGFFPSFLGVEHASCYFQIPKCYGIVQYKKMNFPMPDEPFNGIPIGDLAEYDIDEIKTVKLDTSRIFENMAVWGCTGTGKTSFLKNFLHGLEKAGICFCVLDWHNEFRGVASVLSGKIGGDLLIFNPLLNNFMLNPLELSGLNPEVGELVVSEKIENFISLIKQMFDLGEVQENVIRRSLHGIYYVNDEVTIGNLIDSLKGGRMSGLASKLEKFTMGVYGRIFNNPKSTLDFNELRKKNVIFELGDLPNEVKRFFAGSLFILWWDNLRMSDLVSHVLVLDDFNEYCELGVARKMLSEARKYRQGFICSYQGAYQLSKEMSYEVARNTGTKIVFRQEQTWDKYMVSDAFGGLSGKQMEALSYLDRGEAIVKLPSVRVPIRVKMPLPLKLERVSDSTVKSMMELPVKTESSEEWGLSDLEKEFLVLIYKNHGLSITGITKLLGIKTSRGYELKLRLQKVGFLVEEKIRFGVGCPKKVFSLGDKALEVLGLEREGLPAHYGKEEHVFIKNKIAEILGTRWNVEIENGCDVRVEGFGKKIAVEVETGKSNDKNQLLYNIERDRGWADKVLIVCPNKKVKLEIQENVNNGNVDDVVILTYRQMNNLVDFLPKN